MFRSELSGVLGGLSRVRQINLDDAHVFCAPEQVGDEVAIALRAIAASYDVLGIEVDHYRLSLRGDAGKFLGDDAQWSAAQDRLRAALRPLDIAFVEVEGEAAFYGPKIDIQVADARGRIETLSTVQLDFNQPERFGLEYTGSDGARHRPVMIHRGLLSSMERMVALLIERYAGRMPPWLAPMQVSVLPVEDARHGDAAVQVRDRLLAKGIRARVLAEGTLGARIRQARHHRDAYLAVLGDAELAQDTVQVNRERVKIEEFVDRVVADVRNRVTSPS